MKVKSMRIPDDIEKGIDYVSRIEKIEKAQSFRKLVRIGLETYVAKTYERGKITLREACKLLDMTPSEAIDLFMELGVKGNIRANDVFTSIKSLTETSEQH
ncbi:MAG: hypothetical protein DRG59_10555 [Deltaproteobacteria bacterium]|nr:MAG: hypothetical protein DRG59_10555 [Deltaproteobacteria bacterium]HEC32298.1 hypothetical protein [Deltaproteobacteria bacterium]